MNFVSNSENHLLERENCTPSSGIAQRQHSERGLRRESKIAHCLHEHEESKMWPEQQGQTPPYTHRGRDLGKWGRREIPGKHASQGRKHSWAGRNGEEATDTGSAVKVLHWEEKMIEESWRESAYEYSWEDTICERKRSPQQQRLRKNKRFSESLPMSKDRDSEQIHITKQKKPLLYIMAERGLMGWDPQERGQKDRRTAVP